MTCRPDHRGRAARSYSAAQPPPSRSAELRREDSDRPCPCLDLTGLISATQLPAHPERIGEPSSNSPAVASRESRSPAFSARRSFGAALATLVRDAGARRPDTETVVELALELLKMRAGGGLDHPLRIADLGTGSGAIPAGAVVRVAGGAGIWTDISQAAVTSRLRQRGTRGPVETRGIHRVRSMHSGLTGPFDLIVSGIRPISASAGYRWLGGGGAGITIPWRALDGGADGLDAYRALILRRRAFWHRADPCRGGRARPKRPN